VTAIVGFGVNEIPAPNGSTTGPEVIERAKRIVEAADARGMVVVVGLFYRSAPRGFTAEALANAARTAAAPFKDHRNVMFNVFNEATTSNRLEARENLAAYMRAVKEAAPNSLVGTGSGRGEVTGGLVDLPELDVVMQDAGWDAKEAIATFDMLRAYTKKPVMNIESFGGSGSGFLDDPTKRARAPEGYFIDFPEWRRIYGAWEDKDFWSGRGRFIAGKDSYLSLIDYVGRDPEKRTHLLVHVAGWFQGASRTEKAEQLGPPGTPGRWNNTFAVGPGQADGTPENPGIRWILERIKAQAR